MLLAPDPRPVIDKAMRAERRWILGVSWANALAPSLLLLGVAATLGALAVFDGAARWATSLLALALWAIVIGLAVMRARRIRQPSQREVRSRIEARFGLDGSSALGMVEDRPSGSDPRALALWAVQRSRAEAALAKATTSARVFSVAANDRNRVLAAVFGLVLIAAALVIAPGRSTIPLSPDFGALAGDAPLTIDAWATPPKAFGSGLIRLPPEGGKVSLPLGSTISVRVDGAIGPPVLQFHGQRTVLSRTTGPAWTATRIFDRPATLTLDRLGRRASWTIAALPDRFPDAQWGAEPSFDAAGKMRVSVRASDDHGVVTVALRLRLLDPPIGLRGVGPSDVTIPLTGTGLKSFEATVPLDLRAHPFAGLNVEARLVVSDAGGHRTVSPPRVLGLPNPSFKSLPAQAVFEQRQALVREARAYKGLNAWALAEFRAPDGDRFRDEDRLSAAPTGIRRSAALIDAFLFADPVPQPSIRLGLRMALAGLQSARTTQDAQKVAPLLWDIAQALERGGQTEAEAELNAARDALEQALRSGAGEQALKEAMDRLKQALSARINELAELGQNGPPPPGAQALSGEDLDNLMKALEESGQSGARGEALALLDRLDQMLQNLSVSPGGAGGDGPQTGQNGAGQSGDGPLDDLARQQQDLSDETLKQQNEAQSSGKPGAADALPGLAEKQEALRQQLQRAEGAGEAGKEAATAMENAAKALRNGDLQGALEAQDQALGSLRAAAETAKGYQGTDPLGRGLGQAGQDAGRGTHVPDAPERRRAREVLDEVRRRAAEPARPPEEKSYLERLLDRFSTRND